tara:strand:- start:159 stop:539 length:381 start_codon:yes stop_codon:yes gene_type:complete
MSTKNSGEKGFNLSNYQIQTQPKRVTLKIPDTSDEFDVSVKPLSWSKRNQIVSKCIHWSKDGTNKFDADLYARECLKEMVVEAPWGRTTEAFLLTIDERLGAALEEVVPKAFGGDDGNTADIVKKE